MSDIGIIITCVLNGYEHQIEVTLEKYSVNDVKFMNQDMLKRKSLEFKECLEKEIKIISDKNFDLAYIGTYGKEILFNLFDAEKIYKTVHYPIFVKQFEKYGYVQMKLKFENNIFKNQEK